MCKIFHIRPLGRITWDPEDGAGTLQLGKSDHSTPTLEPWLLNTFERVQSYLHLICTLQTLDLEDTWPLILAPVLRSFLLCPFLIQGPGLCSSCSDWCPWHGLKCSSLTRLGLVHPRLMTTLCCLGDPNLPDPGMGRPSPQGEQQKAEPVEQPLDVPWPLLRQPLTDVGTTSSEAGFWGRVAQAECS